MSEVVLYLIQNFASHLLAAIITLFILKFLLQYCNEPGSEGTASRSCRPQLASRRCLRRPSSRQRSRSNRALKETSSFTLDRNHSRSKNFSRAKENTLYVYSQEGTPKSALEKDSISDGSLDVYLSGTSNSTPDEIESITEPGMNVAMSYYHYPNNEKIEPLDNEIDETENTKTSAKSKKSHESNVHFKPVEFMPGNEDQLEVDAEEASVTDANVKESNRPSSKISKKPSSRSSKTSERTSSRDSMASNEPSYRDSKAYEERSPSRDSNGSKKGSSQNSKLSKEPLSRNSKAYERPSSRDSNGSKKGLSQNAKLSKEPLSRSSKEYERPSSRSSKEYERPSSRDSNGSKKGLSQDAKLSMEPLSRSSKDYERRSSRSSKEYERPFSLSSKAYEKPSVRDSKVSKEPSSRDTKASKEPSSRYSKMSKEPSSRDPKVSKEPSSRTPTVNKKTSLDSKMPKSSDVDDERFSSEKQDETYKSSDDEVQTKGECTNKIIIIELGNMPPCPKQSDRRISPVMTCSPKLPHYRCERICGQELVRSSYSTSYQSDYCSEDGSEVCSQDSSDSCTNMQIGDWQNTPYCLQSPCYDMSRRNYDQQIKEKSSDPESYKTVIIDFKPGYILSCFSKCCKSLFTNSSKNDCNRYKCQCNCSGCKFHSKGSRNSSKTEETQSQRGSKVKSSKSKHSKKSSIMENTKHSGSSSDTDEEKGPQESQQEQKNDSKKSQHKDKDDPRISKNKDEDDLQKSQNKEKDESRNTLNKDKDDPHLSINKDKDDPRISKNKDKDDSRSTLNKDKDDLRKTLNEDDDDSLKSLDNQEVVSRNSQNKQEDDLQKSQNDYLDEKTVVYYNVAAKAGEDKAWMRRSLDRLGSFRSDPACSGIKNSEDTHELLSSSSELSEISYYPSRKKRIGKHSFDYLKNDLLTCSECSNVLPLLSKEKKKQKRYRSEGRSLLCWQKEQPVDEKGLNDSSGVYNVSEMNLKKNNSESSDIERSLENNPKENRIRDSIFSSKTVINDWEESKISKARKENSRNQTDFRETNKADSETKSRGCLETDFEKKRSIEEEIAKDLVQSFRSILSEMAHSKLEETESIDSFGCRKKYKIKMKPRNKKQVLDFHSDVSPRNSDDTLLNISEKNIDLKKEHSEATFAQQPLIKNIVINSSDNEGFQIEESEREIKHSIEKNLAELESLLPALTDPCCSMKRVIERESCKGSQQSIDENNILPTNSKTRSPPSSSGSEVTNCGQGKRTTSKTKNMPYDKKIILRSTHSNKSSSKIHQIEDSLKKRLVKLSALSSLDVLSKPPSRKISTNNLRQNSSERHDSKDIKTRSKPLKKCKTKNDLSILNKKKQSISSPTITTDDMKNTRKLYNKEMSTNAYFSNLNTNDEFDTDEENNATNHPEQPIPSKVAKNNLLMRDNVTVNLKTGLQTDRPKSNESIRNNSEKTNVFGIETAGDPHGISLGSLDTEGLSSYTILDFGLPSGKHYPKLSLLSSNMNDSSLVLQRKGTKDIPENNKSLNENMDGGPRGHELKPFGKLKEYRIDEDDSFISSDSEERSETMDSETFETPQKLLEENTYRGRGEGSSRIS